MVLSLFSMSSCCFLYSGENKAQVLSALTNVSRLNSECLSVSDTTLTRRSLNHLLYLGSGYARHTERDDAVSPFIYRGHAIPIEIKYSIPGQKSYFSFSLFLDKLDLHSDLPDYGGTGPRYFTKNTNFVIGGFYSRDAFSSPEHGLDILVGAGLNVLLNYRLHETTFPGGRLSYLMLDQFNSLSLMVQLRKGFDKGKQFLAARIYSPVISYAVPAMTYNAYVGETINGLIDCGSNVLLEVLEKGEWVSLSRLFQINADLTFARYAWDRFGFELKYSFQFYRFTQYTNLNYSVNLQSGFHVGIIYKIK